jgi:hypothetical protein
VNTAKTQPAVDTQQIASGLTFTVGATDNLALNDISLIFSGGFIDTTDTIFSNQTLKAVTLPVHIVFPAGSGAGGLIQIVGRATDGAGNFAEDTVFIFLNNVNALSVILLSPATGALASQGKYVPIHITAAQTGGIQRVGYVISGVWVKQRCAVTQSLWDLLSRRPTTTSTRCSSPGRSAPSRSPASLSMPPTDAGSARR